MSISPVPFELSRSQLSGLPLEHPAFGEPQRLDILLGADMFTSILLHGCRTGHPRSPVATVREFGCVLSGGNTDKSEYFIVNSAVPILHASALCNDKILCRFWEIEEVPVNSSVSYLKIERSVVQHFKSNHCCTEPGRFIVPLSK